MKDQEAVSTDHILEKLKECEWAESFNQSLIKSILKFAEENNVEVTEVCFSAWLSISGLVIVQSAIDVKNGVKSLQD